MLLYSLTKCVVKLAIFLNLRSLASLVALSFAFVNMRERIYFYDPVHNNIAKSSSGNIRKSLFLFLFPSSPVIADITICTSSQLGGVVIVFVIL